MILIGSPFFIVALFFTVLFFCLKKRIKGTLFKVVSINAIAIFFIVALFDSAAARLFSHADPFRISDNFYHHGLKPMALEKTSWKRDGVSFYTVATNSLGFVDAYPRVVSLKKSGKRVLFLGDSFMEGVGYPWDQTAAGIISKRYAEQGVELLNGSVISYSPKIHYLKLKHFLDMGLEIDELYLFIDTSDIIDDFVYDYFVPKEFSKFEQRFQAVTNFYLKGSYLVRSARKNYYDSQINPYNEFSDYWGGLEGFYAWKPRWTFDEEAKKKYGEKGIALAVEHVDQIRELCRKNNIRLHIAVWPWLELLKEGKARPQYDLWKGYTDKYNIDFISLFEVYESMPIEAAAGFFIKNDIHWNERGNQIAADYIWDHIQKKSGENNGN